MDDYSALAQRIALSIREVRGCLILSRDGLVLAAYPDEEEAAAKGAWLRFCVLGDPEKSFVEFPDQTWAFVRRGPYAAFAMADAGVRPGVMVDQLEQLLLTAESERSKHDSMRLPEAQSAPSGKPRTNLHPGGGRTEPGEDRGKWSRSVPQGAGAKVAASTGAPSPPEATTVPSTPAPPAAATDLPSTQPPPAEATAPPVPATAGTSGSEPVGEPPQAQAPRSQPVSDVKQSPAPPAVPAATKPLPAIAAAAAAMAARRAAEAKAKAKAGEQLAGGAAPVAPAPALGTAPDGVATGLKRTPQKLVTPSAGITEEEGEVDPVMLAREFSRLLQMNSDDDEGSS
jgi:hypothetical protein